MKTIKAVLVCALVACGGSSEDLDTWQAEEATDEAETSAEEAIDDADKAASVFGYAFEATENAHGTLNVQCANRANRFCMYPDTKSRKFCVTGTGMSAAQKTEAEADVDSILPSMRSDFPGWTLTRSCSNTPEVLIEYGNISAGQFGTSILGYISVMPQGGSITQVFPSGAGGAHFQQTLNGQWVVRVDRTQILADFSTESRRQRVRRHALFGGMHAAGVGLGFTSATTNRNTSIALTQDSAKVLGVSSREKCLVANYNPTDPAAWIQTFGCP